MKNVLIISKIYTYYSLGLTLNHTQKLISLSLSPDRKYHNPGAGTPGSHCVNIDVIDEDTMIVSSTLALEPNLHIAYTRQRDFNDRFIIA